MSNSQTPNYGLDYFGSGVPGTITADGGKFTLADRQFLDLFLHAVALHDHNSPQPQSPDPSGTPGLSLDATGGQLPGGLNVYYRVAYVDTFGLETAASAEAVVATPSPLAAPDFPVLTSEAMPGGDMNPGLGAGTYSFALTATDGAAETPLGLVAQITLDGTEPCVDVTYPTVQDGQDGWHVWRMGPGDVGWTLINDGATTDTDFLDDGATAPDPDADNPANSPPTANLTAATSVVTVGCPDPDLFAEDASPVHRWRIYRTFTSGNYAASSLLVELNTTVDPDGGGGLVTTFDDDGTIPLTFGAPLNVSQSIPAATSTHYLLIDTFADLPDPTMLPAGFIAIVTDTYGIYTVGLDAAWHRLTASSTINYRGAYDGATAYVLGDVVTGSNNELYLLHVAGPVTAADPTTDAGTHWTATELLSVSPTITYRGVYSGATAYVMGDTVEGSDSGLYLLHVAGPLTGTDPVGDAGVHWTTGGGTGSTYRGVYSGTTTYAGGDLVTGSDDVLYVSLAGSNHANDPTTDAGVHWSAPPPASEYKGVYSGTPTYAEGDLVTGSDNMLYVSLAGGNHAHDPVSDGGVHWSDTPGGGGGSSYEGVYDGATTYAEGDLVTGSDDFLYVSLAGSNTGHDPVSDAGVHWSNGPAGTAATAYFPAPTDGMSMDLTSWDELFVYDNTAAAQQTAGPLISGHHYTVQPAYIAGQSALSFGSPAMAFRGTGELTVMAGDVEAINNQILNLIYRFSVTNLLAGDTILAWSPIWAAGDQGGGVGNPVVTDNGPWQFQWKIAAYEVLDFISSKQILTQFDFILTTASTTADIAEVDIIINKTTGSAASVNNVALLPDMPTGVAAAQVDDTTATVTFTDSVDATVIDYLVVATPTDGAAATTWTVTDGSGATNIGFLQAGIEYDIGVAARNPFGYSELATAGAPVTTTGTDLYVADAVSAFTVTNMGGATYEFDWTPAGSGAVATNWLATVTDDVGAQSLVVAAEGDTDTWGLTLTSGTHYTIHLLAQVQDTVNSGSFHNTEIATYSYLAP